MTPHQLFHDESGAALLLALLVLSILSLLGLFMAINATTGVQISDNYESQLQATYAALAGLNHARILLRGLALNDLLRGPDGIYDGSAAYLAEAKSYRFRSPLTLLSAQTLTVIDPSLDVSGIPDDGVINTGVYSNIRGTVLIPITGISQTAPDPYRPGTIVISRYFVKAADNSGDASEIAGDAADNPFTDGDGIIIVRSIGVAKTMSGATGSVMRRNSVAVYEARFKRRSTWILGPALVALGTQVHAGFDGAFEVSGGAFSGLATIDPVPGDSDFPDQIIRAAASGKGEITGGGEPKPSVRDITDQIRSVPDQLLLLNPRYLWDFVRNQVPRMADSIYDGDQNWTGGNSPYIGAYDPTKPLNAPDQDPKITVVNGDLQVAGGLSGGGLLVVTGSFSCSGSFAYNGLILVIGAGDLRITGSNCAIEGGMFVASLAEMGKEITFGTPGISISGNNRILSNSNVVQMAVGLIVPSQISFREIANIDP